MANSDPVLALCVDTLKSVANGESLPGTDNMYDYEEGGEEETEVEASQGFEEPPKKGKATPTTDNKNRVPSFPST